MTKFKISYSILVEYDDVEVENPELDEEKLLEIFFENQVGNIDERIVEDLGIRIEVE